MSLRARLLRGVARQLGEPQGVRGRLVGRGLNRGNRSLVGSAVLAAEVGPGQSAADLGFGGGVGLELLLKAAGPSGHVFGVDVSTTMLQAARRRYRKECSDGRLTLLEGTIVELPLPGASLDALITVNTVYFVDDLEAAFAEVARVLKPGARAVVGINDPERMASMPVTSYGFRIRTPEEIIGLLERSGLSGVHDQRAGEGPGASHLLVGTA